MWSSDNENKDKIWRVELQNLMRKHPSKTTEDADLLAEEIPCIIKSVVDNLQTEI